jgi:hypothetical protein
MASKVYQTYEEAAQDYVAQFSALLDIPEGVPAAAKRGAGDVPVEPLVERAEAIAEVSEKMVPLAKEYLESEDPLYREGVSAQLINQAAAELRLAAELLQIAEDEEKEAVPKAATRSSRGAGLRSAIETLELSMQTNLSDGLAAAVRKTRAAEEKPATMDDAKKGLQTSVDKATKKISEKVVEFGGDIAFDLAIGTEWTAVFEGAAMLARGEIRQKMEEAKKGAKSLAARAVGAAQKTVLNVYDKLLALLGKDAEDKARQQIQTWLKKIKDDGKIEVFDNLVANLYRVDTFKKDMEEWLTKTKAQMDAITKTTGEVDGLSDKFGVLTDQMGTFEDVLGFAKFIKIPQVMAVLFALRVGLLATLVYAGYDYIGYKQVNFLDITKGVAQVIQENLGIEG